jgi:hypothetical protein
VGPGNPESSYCDNGLLKMRLLVQFGLCCDKSA